MTFAELHVGQRVKVTPESWPDSAEFRLPANSGVIVGKFETRYIIQWDGIEPVRTSNFSGNGHIISLFLPHDPVDALIEAMEP